MPQRLNDIVRFRGDRLFHGAVSISWFGADEEKSKAASQAFVFHGPKYHGVQQGDVGIGHGHRLMDTASLARAVVRRCYGLEDQPFTLAIAGYGTGKSHLGLTLASLVGAPDGEIAQNVLSAIDTADAGIGGDIRALLHEAGQPCLALTLNGMQSFDLTAEITKQIVRTLKVDGLDPKPLDDLRPRFGQAASLIRMSNEEIINELVTTCEAVSAHDLLTGLEQHDEQAYTKVHNFFAERGMPIRVLGGESVRDVIDVTVREFCGTGKPYRCLLVLFDEFGKYTEFATVRSQIAGSGVLQDLFEAIQANANSACFLGFIQFELNAYVQRVAPEHKNEILRYVTRYQSANRVYLSINLETLIASLIEKREDNIIDGWFDGGRAQGDSEVTMANLARWFPQSRNHRLWGDSDQFHAVIRKGCWPLSPYSTWFLFYLASAGKHLQERSALALLGDVFHRYENVEVPDDGNWSLSPADLWSDALQQELITSEETGQQGAIAHAYASVIARHGSRLSSRLQLLLCAVVLASKLGLQATSKDDAIDALGELSGLKSSDAYDGIRLLQEEYNVLEWDEAFKAFDILGDAVPRTQFLSFVRQRVASSYDEAGKAKLFASKSAEWCELLSDLDCDFAEENRITTREWRYQAVTSNLDYLPQQIMIASNRWAGALAVDDPRGTIIYTYVEQSRDPVAIVSDTKKLLKTVARESAVPVLPILIVLLCDENGTLGQALAEFAVLEESLSEEDRVKFGNLIGAHKEKLQQVIRDQVENMMKQRRYLTGLKEELETHRLSRAGTELFTKIYKTPIPFPFDGFSTAKGNAADTCQELTIELFLGKLDYDGAIAKPVKSKNRAVTVLKESWGIFTKNGDVSRRPAYPSVRAITEKWDDALAADERRLPVADVIRQLCRPPYGGNIASAGLLLSVFVAPRAEKLVAVRDGQQLAVSQWVQEGVFRGKFIDLSALHGVDLILRGEASSEWETLLDEWEQAESHLARKSCLERSFELKNRVPVPPSLGYREVHLREQALASAEAMEKMERAQDEAISKVEQGAKYGDVSKLAWGGVALKELCEKMAAEEPLWTDSQIAEVQPHYERARQGTIVFFPDWLVQQTPRNDAPESVGDFKHKMLRLVGGNLKKMGLEPQFQELEMHTLQVIRKAETIAEAHQLLRDVNSWLTTNGNAFRIVRIAEIRGLVEVGNDYSRKLQGIAGRIQIPEIVETRTKLSGFQAKLKNAESETMKRASRIWLTKIQTETDIDPILGEVESLVGAFESLPRDLEDLQLMRRALRLYQKDYTRLSDDNLNWDEFETLAEEIRNEWAATLGEEEPPWVPEDTMDGFVQAISKRRKQTSTSWIESIESQVENILDMPADEANRFHNRVSTPPPVVTAPHLKRAAVVVRKVQARLDALSVEWLLEKFKELPAKARKEFLQRVQKLDGGVTLG
ncbi:conserved hypothetical protein [uncultured Desulfobacterium sp.]|uniref:Uncharacterized protein n=1 Tax=uncultured Desulfobacterium sp. TaxID=201089 RepID=A0A445N0Z3_9BACT|nr:conserved hypothetical protein [uncultured Desulfobacterium sp.]